jgi:hypothetical protein
MLKVRHSEAQRKYPEQERRKDKITSRLKTTKTKVLKDLVLQFG